MRDQTADKYFEYDNRDAVTCWAKGFYKAQIFDVHSGMSKEKIDPDTGEVIPPRPMLEVVWKVWCGKQTQLSSDYIVAGSPTVRKLKDMAKAFGDKASEDFKRNAFQPADYIGDASQCVLFLGVEENEEFGDRNRVSSYKPKTWQPTDNDRKSGYAMPDFITHRPEDFQGVPAGAGYGDMEEPPI